MNIQHNYWKISGYTYWNHMFSEICSNNFKKEKIYVVIGGYERKIIIMASQVSRKKKKMKWNWWPTFHVQKQKGKRQWAEDNIHSEMAEQWVSQPMQICTSPYIEMQILSNKGEANESDPFRSWLVITNGENFFFFFRGGIFTLFKLTPK